ncbi:MAG: hypothetical protein ACPG77_16465, partial [Nannocystaceae bacterium]
TLTVTQPDADTSPALRIDTPADVMAEAASMAQALVLAQDSRDEADADNEQAKATNGASVDEATKPADAANDASPAEEAPAEVAADFIVPEVVETATPDTEAPSPAG